MDEASTFGVLLRRYRGAAGLTQEALAERAGISVRAVSDLERGANRRAQAQTVQLLARALGLASGDAAALEAAARRGGTPAAPSPEGAGTTQPGETARTNLPVHLTGFIGRRRELAEVAGLLEQARLLTLTGTGGAGKTRLAQQVAAAVLERYPHGVWQVDLAPLTEAALVPQAVAGALELQERGGSPLTRLQEAVRTRRLLLLLDNCEHLLDACATLAAALLQAAPRLRILATSREALGIAGEVSWRIPSLSLPESADLASPEDLLRCESVQLFVERARAVQPHFALSTQNAPAVARICRRLDGIPLALELAAGRLRGLGVGELAARLDRSFGLLTGGSRAALPRQQTLRATLDWSYGLLGEVERRVFARLSVFAGGFGLEAAEAVCAGEGLPAEEVLDVLLRLVDKSLVLAEERVDGTLRYRLLEPLRQYGHEWLTSSGEVSALSARHARFYLELAERAERELTDLAQIAWLDRLELEHPNLTAALAWCLDDTEPRLHISGEEEEESGLRLASALWLFWILRGHVWEGYRWLDRALMRSGAAASSPRARALRAAADLAPLVGEHAKEQALFEESVAAYRVLGERRGLVLALVGLGSCIRGVELGFEHGNRGDYERGTALLDEGVALARATGDPWLITWALMPLAVSSDVQQDEERARARAATEECLTLGRRLGDAWWLAFPHYVLGQLALYEGDYRRAGAAFAEGLAGMRRLGLRASVAFVLCCLGDLGRARGDLAEAQAHYERSLALYRDLDFDREWMARVIRHLGEVALDLGDWPLARARMLESLRSALELGARGEPQVAAALEALGGLAAAQGQAERALRLAGAGTALRERLREPPWPHDRAALLRWLAPADRALGDRARRAAWAAGQAMSLEEAIALALEIP